MCFVLLVMRGFGGGGRGGAEASEKRGEDRCRSMEKRCQEMDGITKNEAGKGPENLLDKKTQP